jgi:Zn-dependent protease/tetratricopeptide (TPR) repeat protein
MKFRLFGIDVEVQWMFWLTSGFFAYDYIKHGHIDFAVTWIMVVFLSVLIHELGHGLAVRRHGIEPVIALHGMGGTTSWSSRAPLSRPAHVVISLAGPFAGFAIGLPLLFVFGGAVGMFGHYFAAAPSVAWRLPPLVDKAIEQMIWVNLGWGAVNLLPVLPFDGGHVLEQTLGPSRARMTAAISGLVGASIAVLAMLQDPQEIWIAMLFGMAAMQSFQRFNAAPAHSVIMPARKPTPPGGEVPAELAAMLQTARSALAGDELARAISIAEDVLLAKPLPPRAAVLALEIIGWARLLGDDPGEAAKAVASAKKLGEVDAALVGATLHATGDLGGARKVLEGALAAGDRRKEVVGPLIQVLIAQGEVASAAAAALDIVDTLSEDDARKMADIALEHRAFDGAARLFEACFARARSPEDAYAAARAHALGGQHDRAVEWLRHAVEAGFSDRARAWSDAALEALRTGPDLEAVLPRP